MKRTKQVIIAGIGVGWLTLASSPASAEWMVDVYVGGAITQNEDVAVKNEAFDLVNKDVSFDKSVSFGGRVAYWLQSAPYLGFGLDLSHFETNISRQTVTQTPTIQGTRFADRPFPLVDLDIAVTAISLDLMLRWPLFVNNQFPNGRLQPFFTVGPGIFIAEAKDTKNFAFPFHQSDTNASPGVKVGLGMAWQFHRHLALFGEYRYTHFEPVFDVIVSPLATEVEMDLNSHHAVAGLSFRF